MDWEKQFNTPPVTPTTSSVEESMDAVPEGEDIGLFTLI